MGSRIMHAIIGNKIAKALAIQDKPAFLYGNIAPDAVFAAAEKDRSHFFTGDARDFSRSVDYQGFLQKYRTKHPYVLGYYTHLIADDIWLKGFFLPWLRNRINADDSLASLYHRDFRLLNGMLLEYYECAGEIKVGLAGQPAMVDLEEVSADAVMKFADSVRGDMSYQAESLTENLNVFTQTQIIGYIETSVEMGIFKLKQMKR
ncbi:zinc dependent phospholipase C family protein [Ornithinibacillus gellani]|uniref:zinc dependent phospholipase C family protein n=1 Tax=Ornithinibacillus gellani TaxID=2293253 RepID=UPI000F4920E3|nr:zinc dependent phospholipase C family protein [Ornithinibacillus gellani]TQS70571.1 zinc dependent phospholipase C family protein [Ornithinibacillus gellani]